MRPARRRRQYHAERSENRGTLRVCSVPRLNHFELRNQDRRDPPRERFARPDRCRQGGSAKAVILGGANLGAVRWPLRRSARASAATAKDLSLGYALTSVTLTSYQASPPLGSSLKSITKVPRWYVTEQLSRQLTAWTKVRTALLGSFGTTFSKVLE
jgi:hypothetical protein